ncbi:MAG TPA: DUF5677 domain-containing protein [bacterium]|jgi:hypothetical protein
MNYDSLDWVLDRNFSIVASGKALKNASSILRDVVDYGTNLFGRCLRENIKRREMVILMSYLHILEMADAAEVLMANSCISPAILQCRSIFEGLLTLEYLTMAKDDVATDYLYHFLKRKMEFFNFLDDSTKMGKSFREKLKKDKMLHRMNLPVPADIAQKKGDLQRILDEKKFEGTRLELQKEKTKYPRWYQLRGGPKNLSELAERMSRQGVYQYLYNFSSETAHVYDLYRRYVKIDKGDVQIKPIRNANELSIVANSSIALTLEATRIIIEYFRGEENVQFGEWYVKKIRKRFMSLDR